MPENGNGGNGPQVTPKRTPEAWRELLLKRLRARAEKVRLFAAYYDGEHRLEFATEQFRKAFGNLFKEFADNWCDLVVDACEERLNPVGIRLDPEDPEGDKDAWELWQANALDAEAQMAHTEALIHGEAYALVWYDTDALEPERTPLITVEHPSEMIVATAAGSRRRLAALKAWTDDDGYACATLFLPDAVYKWRSENRVRGSDDDTITTTSSVSKWIPRQGPRDRSWPMQNPLDVVPVVPLPNRPRMIADRRTALRGRSEIARLIPTQDAINKLVADMLVASEFAAFRQRYAIGLELENDPDTGEKVAPLKAAVDRLLVNESDKGRFGEFAATDLGNYVTGVEMLVQHAASQTRTPPHYFYLKGNFPSGESIKSAETGLVAKVLRKQVHFGEGWEEVLRLALLVRGDVEKAAATQAEMIWKDAESRTESQHMDAVVKRKEIDVPTEVLWELAGFTPQQITRMKRMLSEAELDLASRLRMSVPDLRTEAGPEEEPAEAA